jgi:hypothetical protein
MSAQLRLVTSRVGLAVETPGWREKLRLGRRNLDVAGDSVATGGGNPGSAVVITPATPTFLPPSGRGSDRAHPRSTAGATYVPPGWGHHRRASNHCGPRSSLVPRGRRLHPAVTSQGVGIARGCRRSSRRIEGLNRIALGLCEHQLPLRLRESGAGVDPATVARHVRLGLPDLAACSDECADERRTRVLEPLLLVARGRQRGVEPGDGLANALDAADGVDGADGARGM